jgi:RNAse (barnase) inhibitor barstar
MSGLAAVLAQRHEPGVYLWHAAFPAEEVAHTVEHAGWRFAHVDAWPTDTKDEFLERLAKALELPSWFGGNLDALADSLSDVHQEGTGVVVLWDGWGPFAHADEDAFGRTLKVFERRAADADRPFCLLLRGEGPDQIGLASLD